MIKYIKNILILITLLISVRVTAQEDKIVTLVVSGQGKTAEEAKQIALRSAIEQAFGAFISSNTEILNDSLIRDEVVSISNGNIQKFEILSEIEVPNNGYAVSLSAVVSVTKLTSFANKQNIAIEFNGGLFAANIALQELYEKNEILAFNNLYEILVALNKNSFDYVISNKNPYSTNDESNRWAIPLEVTVTANNNYQNISKLLFSTFKSLSLSISEVENYKILNKPTFSIAIASSLGNELFYFRKEQSLEKMVSYLFELSKTLSAFEIDNGIEKLHLKNAHPGYKNEVTNLKIDDGQFCIFLSWIGGENCRVQRGSLFELAGGKYDPDFRKSLYLDSNLLKGFRGSKFEVCPSSGSGCYFLPNSIFSPLKDFKEDGLYLSFLTLNPSVTFLLNDYRTIEEIKQIKNYTIVR